MSTEPAIPSDAPSEEQDIHDRPTSPAIEDELPFVIRPAWHTDMPFVLSSWRGTFHLGGAGARHSDRVHYHAEMDRLFQRIFRKATTIVACDTVDQTCLLGFVVHTGPELHYVYTRQAFRRMGVARALIKHANIDSYTFITEQGWHRLKPMDRGWRFTPRWTIE